MGLPNKILMERGGGRNGIYTKHNNDNDDDDDQDHDFKLLCGGLYLELKKKYKYKQMPKEVVTLCSFLTN